MLELASVCFRASEIAEDTLIIVFASALLFEVKEETDENSLLIAINELM